MAGRRRRGFLLQLVQCQRVAWQEMLPEVVQLRQAHGIHGGGGLGGGLTELVVAGLQFLDALDVRGQLVRALTSSSTSGSDGCSASS